MNYQLLFQTDQPVRVGLIGAGDFGRSFLFQANRIEQLDVVAVCDRDIDAAAAAALVGGAVRGDIVTCSNGIEAKIALDRGKLAALGEGTLMAELPLDVIVEATGSPEAGARNALAAIEAGKHVVMVSKETASVIGPVLAQKATDAGVVYTTGDGDQPSLCIGLITWARSIGLDVVCAGKAAESDFVYHAGHDHGNDGYVTNGHQRVQVGRNGTWSLWPTPDSDIRATMVERSRALADLPQARVPDYAEMAIVMNNTGYGFDNPAFHAPVARLHEVPELLRHVDDGGILASTPCVDIVNCLRRVGDAGFAGGVFIVVKCHDPQTWNLLQAKGHLLSRDRTHAMIYLPYHLLGVETATSVLSAAILGLPSGGDDLRPVAEVAMRATQTIKAGKRLSMDHGHALEGTQPVLVPPQRVVGNHFIPYYMAAENEISRDVSIGEWLTYDTVLEPSDSTLWMLKRMQDYHFLGT